MKVNNVFYEFHSECPPPDSFDAARGEGYHGGWFRYREVFGVSVCEGAVPESEVKEYAAVLVRECFKHVSVSELKSWGKTPKQLAILSIEAAKKPENRAMMEAQATIQRTPFDVAMRWADRVIGCIPESLTWEEVYG